MAGRRDPSTKATATRERILRAAEDVVLSDGVAQLTLERAAERAGASKGGVLYHFKTRNDLVTAMVERMVERFDAGVRRCRAELAAGDGVAGSEVSYARAYVEECLLEMRPDADPAQAREERIGAALIAAIAAQPDLLRPLQQGFAGWQAELETDAAGRGEDQVAATVARLAADGLWLCELFGIDALTPAMRAQVAGRLRGMVAEGMVVEGRVSEGMVR